MFRFLWPHDFKDTYNIDPRSGLYHLSPQFLSCMQDLRCWTMNSDFLRKYPDFQGDIPISNPLPLRHLNLEAGLSQWCYFPVPEEDMLEIEGRSNSHHDLALGRTLCLT